MDPPNPSSSAPTAGLPLTGDLHAEAEIRFLLARRQRRRTVATVGAVTAVAVVAIVLLVWLLPTFNAPAAPAGLSYAGAEPIALAAVPPGFAASPVVLLGVGIDTKAPTVFSATSLANNTTANCTVTRLSGYPASGSLEVPAYNGSFASGRAPFWGFVFEAGASGPYAVIAVNGTSAVPLATLSGSQCGASLGGVKPLPAHVLDSPPAAQAAWDATGSNYVAQNPNASTLTMTAFGGATSGLLTTPAWLFVYAPCSPFGGGTVLTPAWIVAVGISSPSVLGSLSYQVNCPA